MSFRARSIVALVCIVGGAALAPATAAPAHRAMAAPRTAGDSAATGPGTRPPSERQPPHALPAPRRPEAQRAPSPSLWNPLKRKRMAMPALPAPPTTDVDYAF